MSLKSTKEQLIRLIEDEENKVIALSGKWGTGKSFMWSEVAEEKVKNALYASLFGLSSIEQIKMKLIQSAVPAEDNNPSWMEGATRFVNVLESIHKGFGAVKEVGLLLAPKVLQEKLIVLDDIERKHNKLNIDEVLGFIDEFTQQHSSRFVLILNNDQLKDREVWDTLREKVVDQEIYLNTSSSEAFDIAIKLTPSDYAEHMATAIETCGLTNIRIIRKVIKVVNQLLGKHQGLTNAVFARTIPSIVMLSAIHYKGIEDGPDFDFVLNFKGRNFLGIEKKLEKTAETDDAKRKLQWTKFMHQLGILSTDKFELLVVEFLQSGLFEISQVTEIIDRYIKEADVTEAYYDCQQFFERLFWDHTLTDAELLIEAAKFVDKAHLLEARQVTSLHEAISALLDGEQIAESVMNKWIDALKAKERKLDEISHHPFFYHKLHPRIQVALDLINDQVQANTTIYDACAYIAKNNGWGAQQKAAMASATVQDIKRIIQTSSIPEFKLFMGQMLHMCTYKQTYNKFEGALNKFEQACRSIYQTPESGRLGKLIKALFDEAGLTSLLEPLPSQAATPEPPVIEA